MYLVPSIEQDYWAGPQSSFVREHDKAEKVSCCPVKLEGERYVGSAGEYRARRVCNNLNQIVGICYMQ